MLCFRKFQVAKKFMDRREGIIKISRENFCILVPKKLVGQPFSLPLNSSIEKIFCFRGLYHVFLSKIFCLTVPKHFVEELFYALFDSGIEIN